MDMKGWEDDVVMRIFEKSIFVPTSTMAVRMYKMTLFLSGVMTRHLSLLILNRKNFNYHIKAFSRFNDGFDWNFQPGFQKGPIFLTTIGYRLHDFAIFLIKFLTSFC